MVLCDRHSSHPSKARCGTVRSLPKKKMQHGCTRGERHVGAGQVHARTYVHGPCATQTYRAAGRPLDLRRAMRCVCDADQAISARAREACNSRPVNAAGFPVRSASFRLGAFASAFSESDLNALIFFYGGYISLRRGIAAFTDLVFSLFSTPYFVVQASVMVSGDETEALAFPIKKNI